MIVLDTTVLIYAAGDQHEYQGPCGDLVRAIGQGRVRATTTAEVIQEFVHVRARRRSREDAAALGADYLDLLAPLLTLTEADTRDGLRLFADHPSLGCFDAVLGAAAVASGAQALVSADRAFAAIPGMHHVVPDRTGVAGLLGS